MNIKNWYLNYRDNFIKSTDGKLGILFLDFTDTKLSQIYEQQNVKTFDIFFFIFGLWHLAQLFLFVMLFS